MTITRLIIWFNVSAIIVATIFGEFSAVAILVIPTVAAVLLLQKLKITARMRRHMDELESEDYQ